MSQFEAIKALNSNCSKSLEFRATKDFLEEYVIAYIV